MTKYLNNSSPWSVIIILALVVGFSSCKSQKGMFKSKKNKQETVVQEETPQTETVEEVNEPEEVAETTPVVIEQKEEALTQIEKIDRYFDNIANASSTESANASIAEAMDIFNSSEAVVLIMIYKEGSKPTYDEPTTIDKYMNYLKDTQNNGAKVDEVVYDMDGKIKELILKK